MQTLLEFEMTLSEDESLLESLIESLTAGETTVFEENGDKKVGEYVTINGRDTKYKIVKQDEDTLTFANKFGSNIIIRAINKKLKQVSEIVINTGTIGQLKAL